MKVLAVIGSVILTTAQIVVVAVVLDHAIDMIADRAAQRIREEKEEEAK
jgi:hypothetical protein